MSGGMKIKKIEFVSAGFAEILASDGVRNIVQEHTEAICDRANANLVTEGEGFKCNVLSPPGRHLGVVFATDHASLVAETEEKALSRAVL